MEPGLYLFTPVRARKSPSDGDCYLNRYGSNDFGAVW